MLCVSSLELTQLIQTHTDAALQQRKVMPRALAANLCTMHAGTVAGFWLFLICNAIQRFLFSVPLYDKIKNG